MNIYHFRSQCSVVCKWNYIVDEAGDQGWPSDLLELIGLQELLDNNASLIGKFFCCIPCPREDSVNFYLIFYRKHYQISRHTRRCRFNFYCCQRAGIETWNSRWHFSDRCLCWSPRTLCLSRRCSH